MIKTTSLVMMIGIVEVLKVAQQIIEANRRTAPPCCLRCVRGGIPAVFSDLLAHQPSGGIFREKVVIAVENVL